MSQVRFKQNEQSATAPEITTFPLAAGKKPFRAIFMSERRNGKVPTAEETLATLKDRSQLLFISWSTYHSDECKENFYYLNEFVRTFRSDIYGEKGKRFDYSVKYRVFVFDGDVNLNDFLFRYSNAFEVGFELTDHIVDEMKNICNEYDDIFWEWSHLCSIPGLSPSVEEESNKKFDYLCSKAIKLYRLICKQKFVSPL